MDGFSETRLGRRTLIRQVAMAGTGLALAGCAAEERPAQNAGGSEGMAGAKGDVDAKIFTFALNLEYLEAEYYTRGAYGQSPADRGVDVGKNPGKVTGGRKVQFS